MTTADIYKFGAFWSSGHEWPRETKKFSLSTAKGRDPLATPNMMTTYIYIDEPQETRNIYTCANIHIHIYGHTGFIHMHTYMWIYIYVYVPHETRRLKYVQMNINLYM